MLGKSLREKFEKTDHIVRYSDKDVNESWLEELDFTNLEKYSGRVSTFQIKSYSTSQADLLMHIGAMTDMEECERQPDQAYRDNVIGAENAAIIASELDIPLVYISTAGIFSGGSRFDDWDTPNPLSVYGRTKYLGERAVVERVKKHYVFRSGWMMGGHKKDKKFVRKILDQIEGGATDIYAVDDKYGTPTYTKDFADNMWTVIESGLYGVYNMSGDGFASRYDIAKKIVDLLRLNILVHPVESDHFAKDYSAPRPSSEVLLPRKLQLRSLYQMRPWDEALEDYINDYRYLRD